MIKKSLLLFSSLLLIVGCAHVQEKSTSETSKLYKISVNNKVGYIDKTGRVIVEPQFDKAGDFSEGLAAVSILAGGGGFMLFYCPKAEQKKLQENLKNIRPFDFSFEQNGSQVIYHSNE